MCVCACVCVCVCVCVCALERWVRVCMFVLRVCPMVCVPPMTLICLMTGCRTTLSRTRSQNPACVSVTHKSRSRTCRLRASRASGDWTAPAAAAPAPPPPPPLPASTLPDCCCCCCCACGGGGGGGGGGDAGGAMCRCGRSTGSNRNMLLRRYDRGAAGGERGVKEGCIGCVRGAWGQG